MAASSSWFATSFLLERWRDVPADFGVPEEEEFECGLFLPRDDPDWLGRYDYPARVLLLGGQKLMIVPHPDSREGETRIDLSELSEVEYGHFLLLGWLRLGYRGKSILLPYNTRVSYPIRVFLHNLCRAWQPAEGAGPNEPAIRHGDGMTLKFHFALREALWKQWECLTYFQAPYARRKGRLLRRDRQMAGDLLAFAPGLAIWITDRHGGHWNRYGTLVRYALMDETSTLHLAGSGDDFALEARLSRGALWRVSLNPEHARAALDFLSSSQELKGQWGLAAQGGPSRKGRGSA
jgi:hypothetical protein